MNMAWSDVIGSTNDIYDILILITKELGKFIVREPVNMGRV